MERTSAASLLTSVDSLFTTQAEREEERREKVMEIPLTEITPFRNHPFQVRMDESMTEMTQSVAHFGVLSPALVRPRPEGGYEMVSGHRRLRACELAGLTAMPCVVREMSDDEAVVVMVDSNLQREKLLPSEKAFAYRMKLEAMRRQAGRPSKDNSGPLGQNYCRGTSRDEMAEESGDSSRQIHRYIRLTHLIPSLLGQVDEGRIAMRPAVELSYLTPEEQHALQDTMTMEDCTPSHAQAIQLRRLSEAGQLTGEAAQSVLQQAKPNQREQIKIPRERLSKFFAPGTSAQKMEETIVKALELYRKRQRSMER